MHDRPFLDDEDGTFATEEHKSDRPCPRCGSKDHHYFKFWESSDGGYSDEKHECRACGKTWWVEGSDA